MVLSQPPERRWVGRHEGKRRALVLLVWPKSWLQEWRVNSADFKFELLLDLLANEFFWERVHTITVVSSLVDASRSFITGDQQTLKAFEVWPSRINISDCSGLWILKIRSFESLQAVQSNSLIKKIFNNYWWEVTFW